MTLSAIERGEGNPRQTTMTDIATAFGINVADLYAMALGRSDIRSGSRISTAEPTDDSFDVGNYKKNDLPVIAEGEASPTGAIYWDNEGVLNEHVENRISRPSDVTDPRAYGVVVRGDSMQPMFRQGMKLIVSPNVPVENGDAAYVQLKNGERLVKLVTIEDAGVVLESVNPSYRPRVVKHDDVEHIHRIAYARLLR